MNLAKINTIETLTTVQLRDIINHSRSSSGEPNIENRHFIARVEDEIDDLPPRKSFTHPSNGQESYFYELTFEQATLVGMRESKAVRRAVLVYLNGFDRPQVPQTYAAALLEAGRLASEVERQSVVIDNQIEKLALAAPAVQFMNDFVVAKGDVSLRGAAKELGHSPIAFNRQLGELGIIYKLDGVWTAKQ
jgi:hypothetical protein